MRPVLYMFLLAVCTVIFAPALALSLSPIDSPPQLIRLSGAFLDSAEKARERYPILEMSIAGETRPFYVRAVQSLTSDDQGMPILQNLGAFVVLTGPPDLIARLRRSEMQGGPLQIDGRLYIKARTLVLTAVEFTDEFSQ